MIGRKSRWNRSVLLKVYDSSGNLVRRPYLTRTKPPRRVTFLDNREHQLQEGDTWSNLAHRYLGDSYLWWVICEFNRVINPWTELREGIEQGKTLLIPSIQTTNFEVLTFRRNLRR